MRLLYIILFFPFISVAQGKLPFKAPEQPKWNRQLSIEVDNSETLQLVEVESAEGMQADYSDLRFVINPNGTALQKRFLPYWIETSDAESATIWVGFKEAPEIGSTFTMLYGNAEAEAHSSIYRTFAAAGYYGNDFSRTPTYDIINTLGGYDELLVGPGDASEEYNWPAVCQHPDNPYRLFLAYKSDTDSNHGGSATSKVEMIYTTGELDVDGRLTFSSPVTVADPPEANIGATNAVVTGKMINGLFRVVVVYARIDFTTFTPRAYSVYADWNEATETLSAWSSPVQVGPDRWINIGGQAITLSNGQMLFGSHQDGDDTAGEWRVTIIRSSDGITFDYVEIASPSGTELNETAMVELKQNGSYYATPYVLCVSRNENVTTSDYQYKSFLTASGTMSATTPVLNDWQATAISRYTALRTSDDVIWFSGGNQGGKMVYSKDEGTTYTALPYDHIRSSPVGAIRLYTVMADMGNGRMATIWATNITAPGGSDLYLNYFDYYLMALRPLANATLAFPRIRPFDLDPGLNVNGSLVPGYRTTSATSIAIPTSHPTQRTFTVDAGLSWQAGDAGTARGSSSQRFTFTVESYSGTTLVVNSVGNTSSGTLATWILDKDTNFLADQAFVSSVLHNGSSAGVKLTMRARLPDLGFIGFKKDGEGVTAIQNVIMFNHASNNAVMEMTNDAYVQGMTAPKNVYNDYTIIWTPSLITAGVNAITPVQKTAANGNGICNFDAGVYLYTSTSAAFPQGYINVTSIKTTPATDPVTTVGATSSGSWRENASGNGVN